MVENKGFEDDGSSSPTLSVKRKTDNSENTKENKPVGLQRTVGLTSGVSIIIGTMIGIYY
jgi:hypothetical protein